MYVIEKYELQIIQPTLLFLKKPLNIKMNILLEIQKINTCHLIFLKEQEMCTINMVLNITKIIMKTKQPRTNS